VDRGRTLFKACGFCRFWRFIFVGFGSLRSGEEQRQIQGSLHCGGFAAFGRDDVCGLVCGGVEKTKATAGSFGDDTREKQGQEQTQVPLTSLRMTLSYFRAWNDRRERQVQRQRRSCSARYPPLRNGAKEGAPKSVAWRRMGARIRWLLGGDDEVEGYGLG
jgi:hypothetical protein